MTVKRHEWRFKAFSPLVIVVLFCFSPCFCEEKSISWDFSGKNLGEALVEIASNGRLNIIADVPLSQIESFSAKSPVTPDGVIPLLANRCGIEAYDYYGTWFLFPRGKKGRLLEKRTAILRSRYGIFENAYLKMPSVSSYPVKIWGDVSRNVLVQFGFSDDIENVSRQWEKLDVPRDFLKLSLQVKDIADSSVLASLSVITLNAQPVVLSLEPNSSDSVTIHGKITANFEQNGEPIFLNTQVLFVIPSSGNKAEVIEAFQTQPGIPVSKVAKLGSKRVSLEIMPVFVPLKDFEQPLLDLIRFKTSNISAKSSKKIEIESDSSDSNPNKLGNLTYLDRPLSEILEFVAKNSGCSLVCERSCGKPITLILCGRPVYFEELIHNLAKIRGLALRKIGNCIVIGKKDALAKREIVDRGCGVYFKKLFFNDSEIFARMGNEMLAVLSLPGKIYSDTLFNSVLIDWKGFVPAENVRKLIGILENPPPIFDLNILIQTPVDRVKQVAKVSSNSPYKMGLTNPQGSIKFAADIFSIGTKGYAASKVDFNRQNPGWGKTRIEACTPFGCDPDRIMVNLEKPDAVILAFGGIGSATNEVNEEDFPDQEKSPTTASSTESDGFD